MAYIQGVDRLQTALFCLEDFIAPDAPVRVIDAFCEQVDYITLDFRGKFSCDQPRATGQRILSTTKNGIAILVPRGMCLLLMVSGTSRSICLGIVKASRSLLI